MPYHLSRTGTKGKNTTMYQLQLLCFITLYSYQPAWNSSIARVYTKQRQGEKTKCRKPSGRAYATIYRGIARFGKKKSPTDGAPQRRIYSISYHRRNILLIVFDSTHAGQIIYRSSTYHLLVIYSSSTYHLHIIYRSSIDHPQIIYRSFPLELSRSFTADR